MSKIKSIYEYIVDLGTAIPDLSNGVLAYLIFVSLPLPLYFIGWETAAVYVAPFSFAPVLWAIIWERQYGHLDHEPIEEPGHYAGFLFFYFPVLALAVIAFGELFILNPSANWQQGLLAFFSLVIAVIVTHWILKLKQMIKFWMVQIRERYTKNNNSTSE